MRKSFYCSAGLLCNLIAFVPALLFVLQIGTPKAGLAVGSIGLALGLVLAVVGHLPCRDHPAVWAASLVMLGASKGGCGATLILHFKMEAAWEPALLERAALLSACAVTVLCLCLALLSLIPAVKSRQAQIFLPVFLLLLVAAAVTLVRAKSAPALLLLLNVITLTLCWIPGIAECDCIRELRFYVNIASMLYAIFLFLLTIMILGGWDSCDCDCCDGGSCDCGGTDSGKGKRKK